MSDRLKVLPQYLLPKRGADRLRRPRRRRERGAIDDPADPLVRRQVRRRHGRGGRPRHRQLRQLQRVLHPRAEAGRAAARATADLVCPVDGAISQFGAIDGDQILQAKGHRYTTTALVGGDAALAAQFHARQLRHAVPEPEGLPPHPHAVRRAPDAHDLRAGRAVLGEPDHRARRARACSRATSAWSACSNRARRPVRAGAGRRHHRRQHGDGVARRGQPAARRRGARVALREPSASC